MEHILVLFFKPEDIVADIPTISVIIHITVF